ncbi:isocitrate lyase/phosphoenolpyruvate mutase family protein [Stappia sp. F7233]|uniref:Isocitrate lyase/phosphoenolpyruvate mutase family protein n=1 Tax=Stappia albiluteola TaxID=2758565 RepID=A0A839AD06_9HYPH|nr:isocitrate lyase/phosphoenolpyruvate mutase family protein [Stappia albiluteola]MBA5777401.1 isocitrate lyase/phosphoenolpyruvate mutase family protein [Stappia albiluteola]
MPSHAEKRAAFRALHEKGEAFLMPNPHDVGTALILQGLGFKAIATTSWGFAFAQGVGDVMGLVSRDMALAHAQEIVANTDIPVNGDLENGFGDAPEDVAETIRGAIEVGLAGCSIEDLSQTPEGGFYAFDHAVERIRAGVAARKALAADFVLTARAEAPIRSDEDLDETIRRLRAYAEAGADLVYAPLLTKREHIGRVLREVPAKLNFLGGRAGLSYSLAELSVLGVTRVSIGAGLSRVAFGAFYTAAQALAETGDLGLFSDVAGAREIGRFMRGREQA